MWTSVIALVIYGAVGVLLIVGFTYYFCFHRPLERRIKVGQVQPMQIVSTHDESSTDPYDTKVPISRTAFSVAQPVDEADVSLSFSPSYNRHGGSRPIARKLSSQDVTFVPMSGDGSESEQSSPQRSGNVSGYKNWVEWSAAMDGLTGESQDSDTLKPVAGPTVDDSSTDDGVPHGILKKGAKLRRQDSAERIAQFRMELRRERLAQKSSSRRGSPLKTHVENADDDGQRVAKQMTRKVSFRGKDGMKQHRTEAYTSSEATESVKKSLTRKLSSRSSIHELFERRILTRFSDYVEVQEVHSRNEYDRATDPTWARLSPSEKRKIRVELNQFKKAEMQVHESSQHMLRLHETGQEYQQFRGQEGARVYVEGYCNGYLRFFGPHRSRPGLRCGVELDEPVGKNNGTVQDYQYFQCAENYGLLTDPIKVTILERV